MHFDRIDLRLDASTMVELPGGALQVDGVGAHVGLYTYHDDQGRPFVELVPRETLFDPTSLEGVRRSAPDVTIRHPSGLVTAENWRETSHGVWTDAWPVGDDLGIRIVVKSPEAVGMIRDAASRGVPVELSPGYEVDVVDEPGVTAFGRHDAVQRGRVYNHIALLGPGEARGGAAMRLQLDGPMCAPAGCRVQSHRVQRADGRRDTAMKKLTFKSDGQPPVSLDPGLYAVLRSLTFDASHGDQIKTGRLLWEVEGEDPVEFIFPTAIVEGMFESIGAGTSSAAAPAGMEEEEPEMQAEGAPARPDGLTLDAVEELIERALRSHTVAQRQIDARDAEVSAAARRLNVDASDGRHWADVALDAIVKAHPDAAPVAKRLAADAKRGDAVAEGRLRERLAMVAAAHHDGAGSGSGLAEGNPIKHERPKRADARAPWERGEPNKPKEGAN